MPADDLTPLLPLPVTRLLVDGATELDSLVAPLVRAAKHPASLQRLLHQAGWDVDALLAPEHYDAFVVAVSTLSDGASRLFAGGATDGAGPRPLDVVDVLELGAALGAATAALLELASNIEPAVEAIFTDSGAEHAEFLASQFVADIADILAVRWLSSTSPMLFSIARFAGLVTAVMRPALYLVEPTATDSDDDSGGPGAGAPDASDGPSAPLPIRWPVRRFGINTAGIAQPFLLGLQPYIDELPDSALHSAPGFVRAIGEQIERRFSELLVELSERPVGEISVSVDSQGVELRAPNWLPTAELGLTTPIRVPLTDSVADAAVSLDLVVDGPAIRLEWASDSGDADSEVALIPDVLTLLDRFSQPPNDSATTPLTPGISLTYGLPASDVVPGDDGSSGTPADDSGEVATAVLKLVITMGIRLDIGVENSTELAITATAGWDDGFAIGIRAEALGLLKIPIAIPGLTGLAIGFDSPGIELSVADLDTDPRLDLEVSVDAFTLDLPSPLFRAVEPGTTPDAPWTFATGAPTVVFTPSVGTDDAGVPLPDPELPPLLSLGVTGAAGGGTTDGVPGGIDVDRFELLDLGPTWSLDVSAEPFFVGVGDTIDSGVIIVVDGAKYTAAPGALGDVAISTARVHLPPDLPVPLEEINIIDATIGESGFSGEVSLVFAERPEGEDPQKLFGAIPLWFRSISLVIEDNVPTEFDLKVDVEIPYFEEVVEVAIAFDDDFNLSFSIETAEPEGITLTKDELLLLNFRSAAFDWKSDEQSLALELSGGIEPLLWNADGLEWPRLDVAELRVEQDVQSIIDLDPEPPVIRFREAWLDLKELVTLDLFGFHFELNRIGMGYLEETDELWVDLTGSLRLIELIPVGLGVEGFRITWPRRIYEELQLDNLDELTVDDVLAIASRIQVKFDGIYLFFGVPQTVEFEGFIRFIKTAEKIGFAGDMALRLPSTGLAIEAGLMVGMNFAEPAPYPFLYVYFGIMLPSGIPLGQSGLALKGAKGLFGLNVEPDREPEQNPYYDWYQRGPIEGAHPTNKWRDKIWSIAFGAGITITTTDGKILGVQGLLALVIPGPIVFVEGKALIFDGVFPGDSPLKALGYFDGNELTAQLNIEASMELVEGVIDVMAGIEAFFDFRNLLNWHLYAGVDEPLERRIRANVLKMPALGWLFRADAYLMIDMPAAEALDGAPLDSIGLDDLTVRARMGAYIGFEPPAIDLIVASAEVRAVIDGSGLLTINPFVFAGDGMLDAIIDVDAFSLVTVSAEATAEMSIDGAMPLAIKAELAASVDLPVPDPASVPIIGDHLASVVDWFEETVVELPEVPDHLEVEIPFCWTFDRPPVLDPLVSGVSVDSRFAQGGTSAHRSDGAVSAASVPVVPLDAHPVVAFDQNIGVPDHVEFGGFASGVVERFTAGRIAFRPMLNSIRLLQLPAEDFVDGTSEDWVEIASTDAASTDLGSIESVLWGMFRPQGEFTDQARAGRRLLELWGTNPFEFLSRSIPMSVPTDGLAPAQSVAPLDSLGLGAIEWCDEFEAERHCIGQGEITGAIKDGRPTPQLDVENGFGQVLDLERVEFRAPDIRLNDVGGSAVVELDGPNRRSPFASITFPERVERVEIRCIGKHLDVRADRRVLAVESGAQATLSSKFVGASVTIESKAEGEMLVLTITAPGDGLDRLRLGAKDTVRLVEVCWVTTDSVESAAVSRRECVANEAIAERSSDPGVVLDPGMHYRVDIDTSITLDDGASDPVTLALFELPGFAEEIDKYRVEGGGPFIESDSFHFQTVGPPSDLMPYVKWTSPQRNAPRHFADDDLVVRFNRPYIHRLFPDADNGASGAGSGGENDSADAPYALAALVEDADGRVTDDWFLNWTTAASSTLLPEEAHWFDDIAPLSAAGIEPAPDDVLEVRRRLDATGFDSGRWEARSPSLLGRERRVKWKRRDDDVSVVLSGASAIHRFVSTDSTWRSCRVEVELELPARGTGTAGVSVLESGAARYDVRVVAEARSSVVQIVRVTEASDVILDEMKVDLRAGGSINLGVDVAHDDVGVTFVATVARQSLRASDLVPVAAEGQVGLLAAGGDVAFRRFSVTSANSGLRPSTRYTLRIVGGAGGRIIREDAMVDGPADWWTDATGWETTPTGAAMVSGSSAQLTLGEPVDDGEFFVEASLPDDTSVRLALRTPDERRSDGDDAEYGLTVERDGSRIRCTIAHHGSDGIGASGGSSGRVVPPIAVGDASVSVTSRVRLRVRMIGDHATVWIGDDMAVEARLGGHARTGGFGLAATGGGIMLHRVQVREPSLLTLPFTTAALPTFADAVDAIGTGRPGAGGAGEGGAGAGDGDADDDGAGAGAGADAGDGVGAERVSSAAGTAGSNGGETIVSPVSIGAMTDAIDAVLPTQRAWVDARARLHLLERSAALHRTTRDELELGVQELAAAAHVHDDAMRDLLQTLGAGLLVVPTEPSIRRLIASDGDTAGWLIRSPQPLDPMLRSAGSVTSLPTLGRTEFVLLGPVAAGDVGADADGGALPTGWLSSTDGTTVLVTAIATSIAADDLADDSALAAVEPDDGVVRLRVTRHRDHGDDARDIDHLLDRPYELSRGFRSPVVRTVDLP